MRQSSTTKIIAGASDTCSAGKKKATSFCVSLLVQLATISAFVATAYAGQLVERIRIASAVIMRILRCRRPTGIKRASITAMPINSARRGLS